MKYIKQFIYYKLNENDLYKSDDGHGLKWKDTDLSNKAFISVSNDDIEIIKKGLGFRSFFPKRSSGNNFTYYSVYYNSDTGGLGMSKRNQYDVWIVIYALEDEWFNIRIKDDWYWCDQVEGVIKCIKDYMEIGYGIIIGEKFINEDNSYYDVTNGGGSCDSPLQFTKKEEDQIYLYILNKLNKSKWNVLLLSNVENNDGKSIEYTITRHWGVFAGKDTTPVTFGLSIFKYDDEWYEVIIGDYSDSRAYKCDQFDGLLSAIDNIYKMIDAIADTFGLSISHWK